MRSSSKHPIRKEQRTYLSLSETGLLRCPCSVFWRSSGSKPSSCPGCRCRREGLHMCVRKKKIIVKDVERERRELNSLGGRKRGQLRYRGEEKFYQVWRKGLYEREKKKE